MKGEAPDFRSIDYAVTIGKNLRKMRREINNLTTEEVSARLKNIGFHMDAKTLSKIELGRRKRTDVRDLEALAYVLGCAIRDLWTPSTGVEL